MIRAIGSLAIGLLLVTHFAEYGSVALFVWHTLQQSAATVDHFVLIVLVCGAAIILDCWLFLILFDLVHGSKQVNMVLGLLLVPTAIVFPAMYVVGVGAESPFLAATTERLTMFSIFPLAAWLVLIFWKASRAGGREAITQ